MWFIQLLTLLLAATGFFCADDCETPLVLSELKKCCELPILIEQNLRDACLKEIEVESDGSDSLKSFTNKLKFAECIFQKGDAIIDGKPSATEIKNMVKKNLEDYKEWVGPFNAAVDKCVADVISQHKESQKRASQPPFNVKNVNTMYGHLVGCIVADLMFECPSTNRSKSAVCKDVATNLKNCFTNFPPRFMTV